MKLPTINSREIIPIRLIPFITERRILPAGFVNILAQKLGQNFRFPFEWADCERLYAYHRDDQGLAMIPENAWDSSVLDFADLNERHISNSSYPAYEYDAVMLLPHHT